MALRSAAPLGTWTLRRLLHCTRALPDRLAGPLSGHLSQSHPHVRFQQELTVPSFGGSLWVDKVTFPVKVMPIGPPEHPTMDRAAVKVRAKADLGHEECLKVTQQGHKLQVEGIDGEKAGEGNVAEIKIPLVHSLNVRTSSSGNISAADFMESKYCILQSESGDVVASRIKSEVISLESEEGDIVLNGSIQGKVTITSGSGNVVAAHKVTGTSMDVTTDSGDIRIASCYSDTAKFTTNTGSINARNIHGESYFAVYDHGDCKAHGIDGQCNVFVKKGDVDVHISNLSAESRIHVEEGDVVLRISDIAPVKISIDANDVIPDIKFKNHGTVETNEQDGSKHYFCAIHPNSFSPSVTILAENGTVMLESQDWAASLGLKLPMEGDTGIAPKPSFVDKQ